MGLPQFFVLGASTLRSIVIERPRTVAQLQAIHGIGAEKAAKFGASIVEMCNA
jgi:ATP-dependent DNA helicase RecQ